MSKYDIVHLYSQTPCYIMHSAEYTQEFYIGKEIDDSHAAGFGHFTITAIQDNYKRLGYYSVIISDKSGNPVEFVNVFSPSSMSCKLVGGYENNNKS